MKKRRVNYRLFYIGGWCLIIGHLIYWLYLWFSGCPLVWRLFKSFLSIYLRGGSSKIFYSSLFFESMGFGSNMNESVLFFYHCFMTSDGVSSSGDAIVTSGGVNGGASSSGGVNGGASSSGSAAFEGASGYSCDCFPEEALSSHDISIINQDATKDNDKCVFKDTNGNMVSVSDVKSPQTTTSHRQPWCFGDKTISQTHEGADSNLQGTRYSYKELFYYSKLL